MNPCTEESNAYSDGESCEDGSDCPVCEPKRAAAMREAKAEYDATSPMDRLYDRLDGDLARKKAYAEDMIGSGHEHLLTDDERECADE